MNPIDAYKELIDRWVWEHFPDDCIEAHELRFEACLLMDTIVQSKVLPLAIAETKRLMLIPSDN